MWAYHDGFGWWMLFGGMGTIVFWGALLWFGVFVFRSMVERPQSSFRPVRDDAEQILRNRLAAGELSAEEFRRGIDALNEPRHPDAR